MKDYRNTKYCTAFKGIQSNKYNLMCKIKEKHPRAVDMHNLVKSCEYKKDFMSIYNYKCAYCGVSVEVVSGNEFEIDHLIYKEKDIFQSSKAKASNIGNLILACSSCNRSKGAFDIVGENFKNLSPDLEISKTFFRDKDYYICICEGFKEDKDILDFYKKLHLNSELKRIDYLLMNIHGMIKEIQAHKDEFQEIILLLYQVLSILKVKRNVMTLKK